MRAHVPACVCVRACVCVKHDLAIVTISRLTCAFGGSQDCARVTSPS